ncbi:hypothetical protein C4J90_0333 [Pseudomonas sp. R2-60-08W]|nr:hypothetical protein C4J90_0333 [Pseudomonas sp. R2-60-08W]
MSGVIDTGLALVFLHVRQAWRAARERNQLGCGGLAGD